MKRTAKSALVCLLLCFIMVACVMLSACNTDDEIVSKLSLDIIRITKNGLKGVSTSYVSPNADAPISFEIQPHQLDAQVYFYISADPLSDAKEEVQLCEEEMPDYPNIDEFTFHANVEGAYCVTKQVREFIDYYDIITIKWLPFVGSDNGWVEIRGNRYLEVVIKVDSHIVDYILLGYINPDEEYVEDVWGLDILAAHDFPQVDGKYQNVTEEYLQKLAKIALS